MVWLPQAGPQAIAVATGPVIDELLFGGSRGGGKTDLLLGDFLQDIHLGKAWRGILFRRTYPELDEVLRRCHEIFPETGAVYNQQRREWVWPTGATLKLRHVKNLADASLYHGHSYTWIGWDEITLWADPMIYHRIKATLRAGEQAVPQKRIRSTGNPGAIGDGWVKEFFQLLDYPKGMHPVSETTPEGDVMTRMFIPSRVQDNKILLRNDPGYIGRIRSAAGGDEQLLAAWLDGDWTVAVGNYFNMYRRANVLVQPFTIPNSWMLYGSLDYGETAPTSFGLTAVDYDDNVYRIGTYYQAGLTATEHAENIRQFIAGCLYTHGRKPVVTMADPSMWVKQKLDEQNSRSAADVFAQHGIHLQPGNNDRINGWRICKDALVNKRFFLFAGENADWERTVPTVPRDGLRVEDVDTQAEDHCCDDWRYGMVRFYKPAPPDTTPKTTGNRLIQQVRDEVNRR